MDNATLAVQKQLITRVLKDWCAQKAASNEWMSFDEALCSHDGTVRFSTRTIQAAFPMRQDGKGIWKNGHMALYELGFVGESILLRLSVSLKDLKVKDRARLEHLCSSMCVEIGTEPKVTLEEWVIASSESLPGELEDDLEGVFFLDLGFFERQLESWLDNPDRFVSKLPSDEDWKVVPSSELPEEVFIEGSQMTIISDRWERSKAARKACLAAHGTACAICGTDFGSLYGREFAGKIEVHHRTPLSEIREGHKVDPVKDLVPLCPNCHMVVHSKPGGGAYTVDEVRALIQSRKCDQ